MTLHPRHYRVGDTPPVAIDGGGIEAGSLVAHPGTNGGLIDFDVHRDPACAGVFGGIGHRFAGGLHQRTQVVVDRAVADDDNLDGYVVRLLDPLCGAADRSGQLFVALVGSP